MAPQLDLFLRPGVTMCPPLEQPVRLRVSHPAHLPWQLMVSTHSIGFTVPFLGGNLGMATVSEKWSCTSGQP